VEVAHAQEVVVAAEEHQHLVLD
jgi:hypothetical protein